MSPSWPKLTCPAKKSLTLQLFSLACGVFIAPNVYSFQILIVQILRQYG